MLEFVTKLIQKLRNNLLTKEQLGKQLTTPIQIAKND